MGGKTENAPWESMDSWKQGITKELFESPGKTKQLKGLRGMGMGSFGKMGSEE